MSIGASVPRDRAKRLLGGRGSYVDDISLPRMLHLALVRSPHAHAHVGAIDTAEALALPGVVAVFTAENLEAAVSSWRAEHKLFPAMAAPEQFALARDTVRWQGEAVAAVLATSRAEAEDGADCVSVDWRELPAVTDAEQALAPDAPVLHGDMDSNLAFTTQVTAGDVEAAFAAADHVEQETFRFHRHSGVSLETRGIIADFEPSESRLTVHQSHQTPHQQQDLYARLMGLPEHKVRVICPDVGGAFGLKHHLMADELVACAAARLLQRPVKYIADRLESFLADVHCRDHEITARMAFSSAGDILAIEVDDLFNAGAYGQYPRSSIAEGNQISRLTGAPYRHQHYRAGVRMAFLNKSILGHIRSVGHPIACAVAERLVDMGAETLALDPIEVRRRNYLDRDDFPRTSAGGVAFEQLSFNGCLDTALEMVDMAQFRAEQAELRTRGVYRGIGVATFVELTAIGPEYYGEGGQHISAQETCLLRLEASGGVRCYTGATDQGQGIDTGIQQVVADVLGVALADVEVISGDSALCPVGGGSWGSRGAALGGEAAMRAATTLRRNILNIAAALLQKDPSELAIDGGVVVDQASGSAHMTVAEVARIGHFQPYNIPDGIAANLTVTERYASRDRMFLAGNGLQVAIVEVDVASGMVTPLRHVVVHDCGRILNPLLVREQVRGGAVQGIGAALYEELRYDEDGHLLTGSFADYLVPMAGEMPDIEVAHIETPTKTSELGAKGAGEAGTAGAVGAILNAVNDAIRPFDATIAETPITPPRLLRALGRI
ncbi:MAG: xanthine dehydrogenase family protein molybdopterin-binding subunit [Alphaproteobacteria bacterium]|nr:xanthine dehydrogenase family protein molybdopterin-binding subunit [Alphaproteobacteria bacterium]